MNNIRKQNRKCCAACVIGVLPVRCLQSGADDVGRGALYRLPECCARCRPDRVNRRARQSKKRMQPCTGSLPGTQAAAQRANETILSLCTIDVQTYEKLKRTRPDYRQDYDGSKVTEQRTRSKEKQAEKEKRKLKKRKGNGARVYCIHWLGTGKRCIQKRWTEGLDMSGIRGPVFSVMRKDGQFSGKKFRESGVKRALPEVK